MSTQQRDDLHSPMLPAYGVYQGYWPDIDLLYRDQIYRPGRDGHWMDRALRRGYKNQIHLFDIQANVEPVSHGSTWKQTVISVTDKEFNDLTLWFQADDFYLLLDTIFRINISWSVEPHV